MVTRLDPKLFDATSEITWCAGCGDFAILKALKLALADLSIEPHRALLVSGIGCGSKLPDYMTINGYMTIHGRPLPVATAAKLANPDLHVIVANGDGDSYGIGGNHFVQSCRRNPNITQIVENNQIYGLTKGQYSPTSDKGFVTTTSPDGAIELAFNPMSVALAAGATFIARAFAGEPKHLAQLIAALAGTGHGVHLFASRWTDPPPGVILHRVPILPGPAFLRVLSFAWVAHRMTRRGGFDLIHSFDRTIRPDIYRAGDGCHRAWLDRRQESA